LTVPAVIKEQYPYSATSSPPHCRGRAREGVETKFVNNRNFYPHSNLPPARRKE
jgi:hypothetical protein